MMKLALFKHDSRPRILWDILMLAVVFWSSLVVPYRMLSGNDQFDWIYWLITAVFCLDILVIFNTTVKLRTSVIADRRGVAAHYLRTWFIPDLLAAFPFAAFAVALSGGAVNGTLVLKVLLALRLLRLLKLFKVSTAFRVLQEMLSVNPSIMRLAIFSFWFALAAHFISLGWILIGAGDPSGGFGMRYVRALYWCITTIATIGYGDITPDRNSPVQMIYTIVVQLLGVGMFGYIIGNIATLIANLDVAKANFQRKMEEIREYMRVRKIPRELQEKVNHYYNYLWESRRSVESVDALAGLPHTLGTDIALYLNRAILEKVSLFKDVGEIFIREVIRLLEPLVFLPEDHIIRQGEYGDCMYFVNTGEVEVVVSGKVVARLGAGSFFGETALMQHEKRTATVRTLSYCEVYRLSRQSFDGLRGKYPEFDGKIKKIMDDRLKAMTAPPGG
jgi:voltage-gated potassium channel